MNYTDAYAGQFYQDKPSLNVNTVLNYFLARPVTFHPSAIITRMVQFPDVSFYQGEINYSVMRMQTDAIILRIGQNLWEDDEFERNYEQSKRNGMLVGGYWFYDDRISPRVQAEKLVEICVGKTFELELFIDWENSYGGEFRGLQNVVAMMELVEMAIQMGIFRAKGVGMYTGYYFFRANSNAMSNASQYNYLKTRPLWLAWYTNNPADVLIPAPWTELNLWQFGTPNIDWGQQTEEIDMNWFNGTRQDFDSRYGEAGELPPMTEHMKLESNSSLTRSVRAQVAYPQVPHIVGSKTASLSATGHAKALPTDKYVYASNITYIDNNGVTHRANQGDIWWKVYEVDGVAMTGWIAERHLGQTLLTTTFVPGTTTPPPNPHVVEVYIDGVLEYRKELL